MSLYDIKFCVVSNRASSSLSKLVATLTQPAKVESVCSVNRLAETKETSCWP